MIRPSVAIVMSNYNHARYLRESLGGICGQTRPADEIIVIDDCSTDNSVEIIAEFATKCPTIRFLRNDHRLGVQDAIARAVSLVTADYFIWTAADDRLLPNFLEKSMAVLERHPQAGLCFSETTELRDDSGKIVPFATEPTVSHIFNLGDLPEYMTPADIVKRMKREYLPIAANTVVVRRELLQAVGGYLRQLEWHADSFAYTVVALRYGTCVVAETLALIRATPGSYSQAMHDPARQTIVLRTMLDLLASKNYRDVRRILRQCPSNFSPWLTLMLKVQFSKIRDWDLLFPYLIWKIREFKRGHRLSWADTFFHLLRRAIPLRLAPRLFPDLVAERNRLAQRLGDLTAERDGAANALLETRKELHAIGIERNDLARRLGDLERETRQELHAVGVERDGLTRRLGDLEAERNRLASELELVRKDYLSIKDIAEEYRRALEKSLLPPMLITTMPKSGTYYISKLFSQGLFIRTRIVSQQYFPDDVIRQPELRVLSRGSFISQDHFGASKINLTHIRRHVDRVIVHLRDPRQALLSYVHYLDTERFKLNEKETLLFIYPPLPDDFYRSDLASNIDWAIENWLPLLVQWVQDWVEAANQNGRPRIKFTHYEDLVVDRDKFVSDVLDFFSIPHNRFFPPNIAPDPEIHFRKGEIDEWTQVFSAAQIAAANALIPAALASRFGWPLPDALRK
ncbi:glycosyltransferase [Sulfuricaulis sp.]|jgi:glycosyltransferase involved in cell wall biosynthesis|uniref:glycosyltransferase n=1 Tax=Sulfuricaulis sp. TaxID=2003553 RepID=UPI00355A1EE0